MILLVILGVLLIIAAIFIYEKSTNAICASKKRLDGKTVLVTGGTAGMGLENAKDFAWRGARVIIACPFDDEGYSAEKYLKNTTNNNNIVFKNLDLGSLKSTRQFAADILKNEERLDILINNAGIAGPNKFSEDGLSFIMQVNYFGAYLLTLLLLPLLKKTGTADEKSRIVNLGSVMQYIGKVDFSRWRNAKTDNIRYYSDSKLCCVLFTHELAKRLAGYNVVVNTADPGFVGTNIFRTYSNILGFVPIWIATSLFKDAKLGAQTAIHCAVDDSVGKGSGRYYKNCGLSSTSRVGRDDVLAKELWKETADVVKLSASEMAV